MEGTFLNIPLKDKMQISISKLICQKFDPWKILIGPLRFCWRCFGSQYLLFLQKTPGLPWKRQFVCIWGEFWRWFCLVGVAPQWSTNALKTWKTAKRELCPNCICWTQQQCFHSHSAFQEVTPFANNLHNELLYSQCLIIMNRVYFSWHCHSQHGVTSLVHGCQSDLTVMLDTVRAPK